MLVLKCTFEFKNTPKNIPYDKIIFPVFFGDFAFYFLPITCKAQQNIQDQYKLIKNCKQAEG